GVNLYRREGAFFLDAAGQSFTASSLFECLQADARYSRFVIQARVLNHPDIERLTGTKSLQTVRITSWLAKNGQLEIYEVCLKLILGDNVHDNYDSGRTGNILAHVDPETGALAAPLAPSPDGIGYKVLPAHPVTGVNIPGIVLPHWSSTREL